MLVTFILLTICLILVTFLSGVFCLWRNPPVIRIEVHAPIIVPDGFKLVTQRIPAAIETDKPTEEVLPQEIIEYAEGESDAWAIEGRKRRARQLKAEVGDWATVLRIMQREDDPDIN